MTMTRAGDLPQSLVETLWRAPARSPVGATPEDDEQGDSERKHTRRQNLYSNFTTWRLRVPGAEMMAEWKR